ncbi:hypothetical protein MANES_02G218160v8 [Manihot esculenta]|uniref:Uncharacterized protein n=1 Tax=Manihot esculenta TaxID=3983 RepID=A0ACB7I9S9_MANES|nr:hypothetical protein MANES_02G218160v8 [Manihot esculenta]
MREVEYVNNTNYLKPTRNPYSPYSNTYNLGWRNHPNFLTSQISKIKEHCNSLILRSEQTFETKDEGDMKKSTDGNNVNNEKYIPPKPYMLPIPFPHRFQKVKLDAQFGKLLEMIKSLYMNIPFTKSLSQMPLYDKFIKEILSKKRKLEEFEIVSLIKQLGAIFQHKLPSKLKDPDSFSIPCDIGDFHIDRALYDLGVA